MPWALEPDFVVPPLESLYTSGSPPRRKEPERLSVYLALSGRGTTKWSPALKTVFVFSPSRFVSTSSKFPYHFPPYQGLFMSGLPSEAEPVVNCSRFRDNADLPEVRVPDVRFIPRIP